LKLKLNVKEKILFIIQISLPIIFKINYELFKRNNFKIHSWSWNYRGCWHQTCPPIVTHSIFLVYVHFNYQKKYVLKILTLSNHTSFCIDIDIRRHYLAVLAPCNFRACCLPWKWSLILKRPLRNRTLIPRYPWSAICRPRSYKKLDRSVFLLVYRQLLQKV